MALKKIKQKGAATVTLIISIFSCETLLVLCLLQQKVSFNPTASPFCPAARWNTEFFLLLHSYHILSYTQNNELFSCLYLWGKRALLRAAPVWSIIKYNATWKCIRHETGAWTSHSGSLLVSHFVPALLLTAALCVCICFQSYSALWMQRFLYLLYRIFYHSYLKWLYYYLLGGFIFYVFMFSCFYLFFMCSI